MQSARMEPITVAGEQDDLPVRNSRARRTGEVRDGCCYWP